MASVELMRLWKLSEIDSALVEIRKRAASLDPGKKLMSELEGLRAKDIEIGGKYHRLTADRADLELIQKGIDDKLKKIDKELYGGKIVNPREVENLEKEIAVLKRQKSTNDDRMLEIWEAEPAAKEEAEKLQSQIAEKQRLIADRKKAALAEKATLESEFARLSKLRPTATAGISPGLMSRYEAIRPRNGGIAMAEVSRRKTCGMCGTVLPERTVESLKEDKVVTCETCHSILYYSEGIV